MLTDVDLLAWYTKLGLVESARVVVDHIRSSDPARRVGGGRRNVSGFYPSKKMGVTIQFESHRVELAAVYELEHDDDVLEYFDQPPALKLEYDSADGGHMGVLHTADYFVIRKDTAGWEECKTEEQVRKAVVELRARGINPSRTHVMAAIENPSMKGAQVLDRYIAQSLRELEAGASTCSRK